MVLAGGNKVICVDLKDFLSGHQEVEHLFEHGSF